MPGEAATLAGFVLAGNTLLRPLVNWVNRRPIDSSVTEAKYLIHAVCRAQDVSDVRDLLDRELSRANYPIREVETLSANEDQVELAAILVPTAAEDAELDAVVAALEASPLVLSATWSVEATA
jgi:putative Mg2+ transporter-C (MgtC) family protein